MKKPRFGKDEERERFFMILGCFWIPEFSSCYSRSSFLLCVVGHLAAQRSGSRGAPLALRPMQLVVSHHFLPRPNISKCASPPDFAA